MNKGISVEELNRPLEQAQETAHDTEERISNHATVGSLLVSSGLTHLAKELNNGDQQTTQTDRAKAVSQSSAGSSTGSVLGEIVDAKVPRAVDTSDDGMNCVLEPLRDPIHGKGDEYEQADDLALATAAIGTRRIVVGGLKLYIYGNHGDGVPSTEGRGDESTDKTCKVDMSILLADVNGGAEHKSREGNSRDPSVEAKGQEQSEDEKDDAGRPVLAVEVVDGRSESKDDVEDASDPDELLRERAREPDVRER